MTKTEEEARALCEAHGLTVYDDSDMVTIVIDEETEMTIAYHDGWRKTSQKELAAQWRDALQNLRETLRTR